MSEILTVLQATRLSEEYLRKKGISEPRANAELLLAGILNCKRLDIYLQFDRPLNEKEKALYREYLSRRAAGEPLQYILGETDFFGLKFKIDSSVLIPRPETELLVEEIIKDNAGKKELRIFEIGSGSGNIAIALRKNLSDAEVLSIDISAAAVRIARENARLHSVSEYVRFEKADIFDDSFVENLHNFDIVVSNPPYVSAKEFDQLQKEIREFEPKEAVTDFGDGLSFYKRILELADKIMKSEGQIYFEIGHGQAEYVSALLTEKGFEKVEVKNDFNGIARIVKGEWR